MDSDEGTLEPPRSPPARRSPGAVGRHGRHGQLPARRCSRRSTRRATRPSSRRSPGTVEPVATYRSPPRSGSASVPLVVASLFLYRPGVRRAGRGRGRRRVLGARHRAAPGRPARPARPGGRRRGGDRRRGVVLRRGRPGGRAHAHGAARRRLVPDQRWRRGTYAMCSPACSCSRTCRLLGSFAVLLARPDDGDLRVLSFVLLVVCSDFGGFVTGVRFGKHPMAPAISPKKSWEGFAGSVGVLPRSVASRSRCTSLDGTWWEGLVLAGAAVVSATLGDLGESTIKRHLGIKDMSSLLPGHGGVMDRLDSLLVTAPVVWVLLTAIRAPGDLSARPSLVCWARGRDTRTHAARLGRPDAARVGRDGRVRRSRARDRAGSLGVLPRRRWPAARPRRPALAGRRRPGSSAPAAATSSTSSRPRATQCRRAGTPVRGAIEDERRTSLMRTHSGLHVVCGVIFRDFQALATGSNMEPLVGRIDFNLPEIPAGFKESVEAAINVEIAADRPIVARMLPRAEALAIPNVIKTQSELVPTTSPSCGSSTSSGSTSRPTAAPTSPAPARSVRSRWSRSRARAGPTAGSGCACTTDRATLPSCV